MSKRKEKSKKHGQLAKIYQSSTVNDNLATVPAGTAASVIFDVSPEEIRLNKLMRRDIFRTVAISIILILILSAIYAIRDTKPVTDAINWLAVYTGF